jgi:hypothetical protein
MKIHFSSICVASIVVVIGSAQPSPAQAQNSTGKERIGVYDSRAIAVAFAGSPEFAKKFQELKTQHQKAEESGNLQDAAKLKAEGKAWQEKLHEQGFSTAPVDDLLLHITNALPEIQKSAGVTSMLSKWDEAGLQKHPGAETVDLTMRLVDAFHPNEKQRNYAAEIQKHQPTSIKQVENIKH